ncbi:imm11 family protein [Pseudomonas sp. KNUC1026]|uniref:imm11 family protein n=1 Tax=Pseudomonas sp. KNUC1026 TaxID=2893890 RepID=UPI001F1A8018|nr:DUF1629 domain-containing protein [Pseudomonas sp. KNUC1026]UFH49091.1 hypothetical protein LN139_19570 [Pseudomonas sp. KNUC1026]
MLLLRVDEKYPESLVLFYDHDKSNDLVDFRICQPVEGDVIALFTGKPKANIQKLKKTDFIESDGPLLISQAMGEVIKKHAAQIELFSAEIRIGTEIITGYCVLNILKQKPCIDLSRSDYRPTIEGMPEYGLRFHHLHSLSDTDLASDGIVRASESHGEIFVSTALGDALTHAQLSGFSLIDASAGVNVY